MKRFHSRFRAFLLMLALGLASVPFFNCLYEKWMEIRVDLPQVQSETPIYITSPEPVESESIEEINERNLIQNRDLSIYDIGKTFSDCRVHLSNNENCEQERIDARKFILSHWKGKKRAYIIYEWQGCDNGGSYHIFIEPDKRGRWHFIERTYTNNRYEIKLEETKGYSIKYKRAANNDYPLKKGTYFLSVLDKSGEAIEKL